MKKLYLSKHKNGYYYIYYNDDNGKRQSITTKTKIKSEAHKVLSNQISFQIDFKDWQNKLTKQEKTILSHLLQGYKAKDIADILQLTYQTVRTIILKLKQLFLDYFRLEEFAVP